MLRLRRAQSALVYVTAVVSLLFVISATSLGWQTWQQRNSAQAVIVSPVVESHSGPSEDYLVEFVLHAGSEVQVLETRQDWARIELPGGLQGWLPLASVERI